MNKRYNEILTHFLKGLSILVPFGVTIYVSWRTIEIVNLYVCSFVQYVPLVYWTVEIPGLSILITCIAIAALGYLGSTLFLAPLIRLLENLVMKIPLVNILYSYTKESTFGFLDKLNKPVMVKITYNGYEAYKIGFLTQEKLYALSLMETEVAVYLPHSYAFSGELMIFPKEQVTFLDISTTEAMRIVLTGGLATIKRPFLSSGTSYKKNKTTNAE